MTIERDANLLRNFEGDGVYQVPDRGLDRLLEAAAHAGLACFRIDLAGVTGRDEFLERLAASLNFPDWFGRNWDALADCLADLSWIEAEGYCLLLENIDAFRRTHSDDFGTALQVFAAVADSWREAEVPFWVFVDLRAEDVARWPGSE